jgi:uncharacterized protein (TIGR00369 family)
MVAPVPAPEDVDLRFPADGGCFGCSTANPDGLQMAFRRRGKEVEARYTVADRFHGAPGVVHGGIVATLLDEVSCALAVFVLDRHVVTGELTVRYERPVPVAREVVLRARVLDRSHPRYAEIGGEVCEGDTLLVRSRGKFFYRQGTESAP